MKIILVKFRTRTGFRLVARVMEGYRWSPYYKTLNASCMQIANVLDWWGAQHAFTKGRSQVTNAMAHVGKEITLSFELDKFFDCVTYPMMIASIAQTKLWIQSTWLTCQGQIIPGFPTTPAVANIIASNLDNAIAGINTASRFGSLFVYTRYGQRLYFSFNGEATIGSLMTKVPAICKENGYTVDHNRTRVQRASAGRRIITGIAVDDDIHPTRKFKRRFRAALNQGSVNLRGYANWMALKKPKDYDPTPRLGVPGLAGAIAVPPPSGGDMVTEIGRSRRQFDL